MLSVTSILSGAILLSLSKAAPVAETAFQYYDLTTPEAAPCDLTIGPDGAIWVCIPTAE